jgi:hypothetical protein
MLEIFEDVKVEEFARTNKITMAEAEKQLEPRGGKIAEGHAHRFRDTFAVELLLAGVPLERVSVLLGHSSIKVTEKPYSPWIRERQEQAEADVKRAWAQDPLALLESKGTLEVHEKRSGFELKENKREILAERVGFEPTVRFPARSLSRRVLSTAQSPLRGGRRLYFSRPMLGKAIAGAAAFARAVYTSYAMPPTD